MGARMMETLRRLFTMDGDYSQSDEVSSEASVAAAPVGARREGRARGTLVGLPSPKKQEVLILEPGSFAEAHEIAEALKVKKCVILNMRRTDKELSRRIVDFLSGMAYALDGYTQKVAEQIYLFTPSHIEIMVPDRQSPEVGAGMTGAEHDSGGYGASGFR